MSTSDLSQQGAIPPIDGALPQSDGISTGQGITSTYLASRFANSGFGLNSLMESEQQARSDQYRKATGSPLNDTYSFGDLPDAVDGAPVTPSWQAQLYHHASFGGAPNADMALKIQLGIEQKVADYNTQNPDAPLPTARDMYKRVQDQANMMNEQASEDAARMRGVTLPLFGKVTVPGLLGGVAAMASLENPDQLALLAVGGPATKAIAEGLTATGAITSTIATRAASGFALNAGVTAAGQFALTRPSREGFGLPFDKKAAAFQSLAAGIFGATMEGVGGAADHYFPGTTPDAAKTLGDNLSDIAQKDTKIGQLAQDLKGAQTPEAAAAAMAGAPIGVKSALLDRLDDEPASAMRGGMQAMERENIVEAHQPEDLPWDEHVQRATDVQNSIENSQPMPGYQPVASTHIDDALNELRLMQAGDAAAKGKNPPHLLQFIAERGGVYDSGGELAAMDAGQWHKGQRTSGGGQFQRSLIRPGDDVNGSMIPGTQRNGGSKYTLDDTANAAWENGYFPEHPETRPTVNDLLDKIETGLQGKDHFPQGLDNINEHHLSLENLSQELDKAGIDLNVHTNEEAWKALNAHADAELEHARANERFGEHLDESDGIGAREEAEINAQIEEMKRAVDAETAADGEQQVIPGAGRISDRAVAERAMNDPLRPDVKQRPADDGLFDVGGRSQNDLFASVKADDVIPLGDVTMDEKGNVTGGMTMREALESIRDDENLSKAMQSCLL